MMTQIWTPLKGLGRDCGRTRFLNMLCFTQQHRSVTINCIHTFLALSNQWNCPPFALPYASCWLLAVSVLIREGRGKRVMINVNVIGCLGKTIMLPKLNHSSEVCHRPNSQNQSQSFPILQCNLSLLYFFGICIAWISQQEYIFQSKK